MTRWRCPICDELIMKAQLFPVRQPNTRKWVAAYHRICIEILLTGVMAWFDAREWEDGLRSSASIL
jgi:hypothetical protein